MKRVTLVILLAVLVLAILATAVGCAPARQAVHTDNASGVSVRLPMVESPDVSIRAEEQERLPGPIEEPPSVADEYRGRWLTLIEVNVSPPPEAEKPAAPESEKSP